MAAFDVRSWVLDWNKWYKDSLNTEKDNQCHVCDKLFSRKQALVEHLRHVHKVQPPVHFGYTKCWYEHCSFTFSNVNDYRSHLKQLHKFHIETERRTFESYKDFLSWKCKEEQNTLSQFISKTGVKRLKNGCKKRYFGCYRTGKYESKSTGKRRPKLKGSCKIGHLCTASMEVEETENSVYVIYYKTHHGHETHHAHLSISSEAPENVVEVPTNLMD